MHKSSKHCLVKAQALKLKGREGVVSVVAAFEVELVEP
jgi:hypothetical protein